ncbi:MAG: DUF1858 domain-containing protein [Heliobacteriaceae bacterium]|nr:DUF1858 domain-containing protein [Heliobacteriaceae bacterium]MDD4586994.1 DUF1858 domain-containing protein [Heliobacteriaceae bacterium]
MAGTAELNIRERAEGVVAMGRIITEEMSLLELFRRYPGAKAILARHGMGCLGCMGSATENIEGAARMHGVEMAVLLAELRKLEADGPD